MCNSSVWYMDGTSDHLIFKTLFHLYLFFQLTYLFDNEATVFFAAFMSLWGK